MKNITYNFYRVQTYSGPIYPYDAESIFNSIDKLIPSSVIVNIAMMHVKTLLKSKLYNQITNQSFGFLWL